jgi:hypothetical protein
MKNGSGQNGSKYYRSSMSSVNKYLTKCLNVPIMDAKINKLTCSCVVIKFYPSALFSRASLLKFLSISDLTNVHVHLIRIP